jgi:Flp pilus assembly protein TadD
VAYEKGRAAATAEEAEAAYRDSIRLDPSRPEPWNALALLALARGNRPLARTHLVKALELDPAYAPALHNLDRLDRDL